MKQMFFKITAALMLASVLTGCLFGRNSILAGSVYKGQYRKNGFLLSMTYEEKKKEAEERKKKLEQDRIASKKKLEDINNDIDNLEEYIKELDNQMMENDLAMERLSLEIENKEKELGDTRILLEETKILEKDQYEAMCRRIQYMYENGNMSLINLITNAESLTDFLNQAEYFSKITEYDNNLFNSYINTKQLAIETEAMLELDIELLDILYTSAEENRNELLVLIDEKQRKIDEFIFAAGIQEELLDHYLEEIVRADKDINEIIAEEQERIKQEEEQRKREEEEQRRREEERRKQEEQERQNAASGIPKTNLTSLSDIIWPLPGDGRIYSKFGVRVAPTAGASTYHRGVDIGGEYNASIVAVLAGTVEMAGYSTTGGNSVKINHGDGVVTAYLHCSKMLVKVGDQVKQGEVIAYVGSTGVSTGPHLHFGISINGTYVDPLNYISYK